MNLTRGERWARAIALCLFCTAAVPSHASVVFSSGPPNQLDSRLDDRNTAFFDLAQSFSLTLGTNTITDAHWWGNCATTPFALTTCPGSDSFDVTIFTDIGGVPGGPIDTLLTDGSANRAATGNLILGTYTEYAYSIAFSPLTLTPNTRYWFEVSNAPSVGNWYLEAANFNASLPSAFSSSGTGGAWVPFTGETFAIQLTNDALRVPEPATLALVSLGLAGLGFWRRRKTS